MSCFSITPNLNKTAIFVTFSGRQLGMATMTFFEFRNFLQENFPNYDQYFFVDRKTLWYTRGLEDITSSVEDTLEYLKKITEGYQYKIFIGASMGGWAACLYGSLLNVDYVIAFRPQTILDKNVTMSKDLEFDLKYHDIKDVINNTTKYYLYGDTSITDNSDVHSFNHCKRMKEYSNVTVVEKDKFDIKEYKDRGHLKSDFNGILSNMTN